MGRFDAPAQPQVQPRFTAPGLGGSTRHTVPQGEDPEIADLQQETPETGFFGILSRSRFNPPPRAQYFGHGSSNGTGGGPLPYDPANRYRLGATDLDPPLSLSEADHRIRTSGLGVDDIRLAAYRFIDYVRNWSAVASPGTRPEDPIRWGDGPPVIARRSTRYTLRPEFMQDAQNFIGIHTAFVPGAAHSTALSRMRAPRVSRLTNRAMSGSYGQETEVLNAAI